MELHSFIKEYRDELNKDQEAFFEIAISKLGANQVEELARMIKKAKLPITDNDVFKSFTSHFMFKDTIKKPWRFQAEEWFEGLETSFTLNDKVYFEFLIEQLIKDPNIKLNYTTRLSDAPKYVRNVEISPFYRIFNNKIYTLWLIRLYNQQDEPGRSFYLQYEGIDDLKNKLGVPLYRVIPEFGIGYDKDLIDIFMNDIKTFITMCAEQINKGKGQI